jgi:RHS repeat-associated protein
MNMPGRKFRAAGNEYRYGFNGQEKSTELQEDSYHAEFWQYDARLGRRFNPDPIYKNSPYETFGGNPLLFSDPYGLDTSSSKKGRLDGDVFRSKTGNSYFYEKKVNGKWQNMGESSELEAVTVSAKRKRTLADNSGLNIFNNSVSSRVWREDYWAYKFKAIKTGLDPDRIKMYDRWIQADEDYRAMSLGAVGIIAAPLVVLGGVETGTFYYLVVGTKTSWAARASITGMDIIYQAATKGGFNKVNPLQSLTSSYGPLSYALTSNTNFEWSSMKLRINSDMSVRRVVIGTAFNALGGKVVGVFEKGGAAAAAGPVGSIPGIWGDGANELIDLKVKE